MRARWERYLERWTSIGLIESAVAERIRAYEAEQEKVQGLRWPVLLAISLGGLLLGAGALLFVAAHWDRLSPAERFGLVLLLVGFFHVAGAMLSTYFSALSSTLHAVGTVCLGVGIFLAGQIFHLQEHWPGGLMLWAMGAWIAWGLLRDWPQATLVALLTPMWIGAEWIEASRGWSGSGKILAECLLLLAISYLTGISQEKESPTRKALAWLGGLALIPAAGAVMWSGTWSFHGARSLPAGILVPVWTAALALPLVLAWWLRRKAFWINLIAALWVLMLGATALQMPVGGETLLRQAWRELGPYGMCALGSIGLIAWGVKEARRERINLGVAGFALTVLFFYFSNVMDKLGRAASLVGLGVLFLLGGWLLEKMRRRLLARLEKGAA
ncbi:DUF2157 domain-containing protein [Desulforhabdus sp. TSK]|uniref:DUF2157 domain-containing protein n=1 Tax=Desulforhabdus sp. TSK TaxID=2925014 RepID=UPI001FC81BF7|nr:DUF2157 domain-containing protein [Desulforhabdus sp. TSK]GKT08792.1 hypothetical protein DSTSK_20970 [Desulforhabdus sp. TSK]